MEDLIAEQQISECPLCGGPRGIIGKLGKIIHIECRNCGMKFTKDTSKREKIDSKSPRRTNIKNLTTQYKTH